MHLSYIKFTRAQDISKKSATLILMNNLQSLLDRQKETNIFKKIQLIVYPESNCNIHCSYCGCGYILGKFKVSDDEIYKIIDEAAELGVEKILFTGGGEPTLDKERIIRLSAYAKSKGMVEITLVTNGTYAETFETAMAVQQHFTSTIITIEEERIKRFGERLLGYVANAAKAILETPNKELDIMELRNDPEVRIELVTERLSEKDIWRRLLNKMHEVTGISFEIKQIGQPAIIRGKCYIVPMHIFSEKRQQAISAMAKKIEEPLSLEKCSYIQEGTRIDYMDITYAGNLYPCCTFGMFKNGPLLTKEEIERLRRDGKNALSEAITRAFLPEWEARYRTGCSACRLQQR